MGASGTIELDDFIKEFDTWCDMQQLQNPHQFTPFLAWKGLFQHLEGLPMDDYHEFCDAHEADIKERHQYWLPNYFSITKGQLVASTPTPSTIITKAVKILLHLGVVAIVQLSRHGFFLLLTLSLSSLRSFSPISKV